MTIAAILKNKGYEIVGIEPTRSVADAATLLAARRIGAILVLAPGRELVGIISERDIVRALAEFGAGVLDRSVSDLMTRELQTATCETTVQQAMEMMTLGRFRHLPVEKDGKLYGIVSIGDVVKRRLGEVEREAEDIRMYIATA